MVSYRRLERTLKPHGLTIKVGGKHLRILDTNGKHVYTASISPSCPHAWKNTVKDLTKGGYLPQGVRLA